MVGGGSEGGMQLRFTPPDDIRQDATVVWDQEPLIFAQMLRECRI